MSAPVLPSDQRYFFVHLMKTAGTVVTMAIYRAVGEGAVYPGPGFDSPPGVTIDSAGLVRRWPEIRQHVAVVAGHFPYCTVDGLDRDMAMFTVLRDPIDRVLSLLRVERSKLAGDDQRSLADIYAADFVSNPLSPNHMARMLGTSQAEMPAGLLSPIELRADHVDAAIDRLDRMAVVGFQDALPAFGSNLRSAFGWELPDFGRGNVSQPAPVPEGLRDRISEDNALDVALYERARARLSRS